MTISKVEAIKNLRPNAAWSYEPANDVLHWLDDNEQAPTDSEIQHEMENGVSHRAIKSSRRERDRLLADSDWVTIRATDTGNPVPTEWQTYRQSLRDITEQTGFPENIDWPEKPA